MSRVIMLIVAILALDILLVVVCAFVTMDLNMVQISRAIRIEADAPSAENHRAVEEAFEAAHILRLKIIAGFGFAVFVVTSGGFFTAGRRVERVESSTFNPHATPRT